MNYLTKYHSCKKKNLSLPKCLTQKMYSLKNNHNHKKNLVKKRTLWNSAKKNSKKKFPKKISKKKLKKGYQDFHAPKQGRGGQCLYKCVMVIASVYGYIDKQTDGIDRHGDRHKDRETGRYGDMEQKRKDSTYLPIVWSFVACRLVVSVGSFHFGSFRLSD